MSSKNNTLKQEMVARSWNKTTSRANPNTKPTSLTQTNNKFKRQSSKMDNNATGGASGTFLASHMQQMEIFPLPAVNAPTSLTNLAQLSGITLMPMKSTTTKQTNHKQSIPSSVSNIHSAATTSVNFMNQTKQTKATIKPPTSTTKKPTFNLANIPSIQILNQTTSSLATTSNPKNPKNNLKTTKANTAGQKQKLQSARNTNPKAKQKANNLQQSVINSTISQTNDFHVIPVTETMPLFGSLNDTQHAQSNYDFDDILPPTSLDSTEEKCVDVNGDINNISLIKLMAILNNPALTITAVQSSDNRPSPYDYSTYDTQSSYNEAQQTNNNTLHGTSSRIRSTKLDSESNLSSASNRNRVQQSVANLQKLNSSNLNQNHSYTPFSTTNTISINPVNEVPTINIINGNMNEHTNLPSDWSTAYSASCSSDNQPMSWINNIGANLHKRNQHNDKSTDATMLSTSVRNLILQQTTSDPRPPTVSVQLLKHIANQSQDDNWTESKTDLKSVLEPECILSVNKDVQQFNSSVAKRKEIIHTVTSLSSPMKRIKTSKINTTTKRLFVPQISDENHKKIKPVNERDFELDGLNISVGKEREVHISDKHFILDTLIACTNEDRGNKSAVPEPDEIFINRSKRVMSKIDTMIERKKRRRFERISSQAAPKTNSLEDQCAESEDEWSSDENMDQVDVEFIRTHIPLDEVETEEKSNHLISVGLVSREKRNQLLVEQYQKKAQVYHPLTIDDPKEVQDIERFVETIVQTGGTDVDLRLESNIKRNDLPLIEGLNRNTSRYKMSYMSVLGLEKRSKRTTLYKVKTSDNNILNETNSNGHMDLNKVKVVNNYEKLKVTQPIETTKSTANNRLNFKVNTNAMTPQANRISLAYCRGAMTPPSKNEYMKSLGLMAS